MNIDALNEYNINDKITVWCFEDDNKQLIPFPVEDSKYLEQAYLDPAQSGYAITHDSYVTFSRSIHKFTQQFKDYQRDVYRIIVWSFLNRSDKQNTRWMPVSRRDCIKLEQAFFDQCSECLIENGKVELSTPIEDEDDLFFVFRSKNPSYKSIVKRGNIPLEDQC